MFHKFLAKSYAVILLILVACLMPGSQMPDVNFECVLLDKIVHFFMYIPLVWTLGYGFKLQFAFPRLKKYHLMWAFLLATLYGVLVEVLQFTVTIDRAADVFDMVANTIGAALGMITFRWGESLIQFWNRIFRLKY